VRKRDAKKIQIAGDVVCAYFQCRHCSKQTKVLAMYKFPILEIYKNELSVGEKKKINELPDINTGATVSYMPSVRRES
jgi:hypothetical protein